MDTLNQQFCVIDERAGALKIAQISKLRKAPTKFTNPTENFHFTHLQIIESHTVQRRELLSISSTQTQIRQMCNR